MSLVESRGRRRPSTISSASRRLRGLHTEPITDIRGPRAVLMDAAHIFRQGLGTVAPRHAQPLFQEQLRRPAPRRDELSDGEVGGARVAHTLTACCRCRQVCSSYPPSFLVLSTRSQQRNRSKIVSSRKRCTNNLC